MAIQIVIDGYNVIGGERGLRGDLEGKRKQLIQQLQQYRERKGYPITVVFDGRHRHVGDAFLRTDKR